MIGPNAAMPDMVLIEDVGDPANPLMRITPERHVILGDVALMTRQQYDDLVAAAQAASRRRTAYQAGWAAGHRDTMAALRAVLPSTDVEAINDEMRRATTAERTGEPAAPHRAGSGMASLHSPALSTAAASASTAGASSRSGRT